MAINMTQALALMKARMNRLEGDTSLDTLFQHFLQAACLELEGAGITLQDNARDMDLVINTAVWHYQSRDSQAGMPEWLRLQRRERWLCEGRDSA